SGTGQRRTGRAPGRTPIEDSGLSADTVDDPKAQQPEPDPHVSVLPEPVQTALQPRGGVGFRALDCTVGAGGHSFALLEQSSPDGRLVGLDADQGALEVAAQRLA